MNRDKNHGLRVVSSGKPIFRRASTSGPGNRVSNIARHFERMSRENERANRRYAVIRGRRARPVASARATVEVLDSLREAIKDESDHSSDSSSVADDEDEDDDEREHAKKDHPSSDAIKAQPIDSTTTSSQIQDNVPEPYLKNTSGGQPVSDLSLVGPADPSVDLPVSTPPPISPVFGKHTLYDTPSTSDIEVNVGGLERHSTLMKALSGLWPPQLPQTRQETEPEDPLDDPEHIFRECKKVSSGAICPKNGDVRIWEW